ncbi:MAG: hypothetical protein JWO95_2776 [Verrucomicrobiales bacterium]|nr:hypothetical protein [Verrucomicrobiales bacterium]
MAETNKTTRGTETTRGTDANRDPITGTPGSHPVGTGVGAAVGGAAAGAAVGSVAGPVGTVAGIVGGAIVGGLAGKGVAEKIDPTREDAYWRENHAKQSFGRERGYDDYSNAYRTGYSGYDRYGREGRTFEDSESDLQRDYETNAGTSGLGWTDAREAARAAWHRVHGRWDRLTNYDVQDASNTKIGTVHSVWVNDTIGQPTFVGVKTGWMFGKNHVVPIESATVNDEERIVRLPFSEEKIKEAPAFDADRELSDMDEQSIYSYFGMAGAPSSAGRLVQLQGETEQTGTEPPRFQTETGERRQATPPYEPKERSRR